MKKDKDGERVKDDATGPSVELISHMQINPPSNFLTNPPIDKPNTIMSNENEPEVSPNVEMVDVESHAAVKRKRSEKASSNVTQFTIRNPPWSYLQLSLITNSSNYQLDALTAHLHLRAALSQFLGLHGTAIPIDILKLNDNDVHIRVPNEDASAVVIAVGGWVGKAGEGWRVKNSGSWGAGLHSTATGADLFK